MNQRDRGQQGRRGGRDDEGYARSQRDTYSPEPQWLRQDRESRQWTGGRDEEVEYGIGGSQYGGNQYGYGGAGRGSYAGAGRDEEHPRQYGHGRRGQATNRDFGGRDYGERERPHFATSNWDDELTFNDDNRAFGDENRYTPFRVGTGMGLGSGSEYGRHRDFGESYGSASGYGSRAGWDLGTNQRDFAGDRGWKQESYRGMGPANYKRSDERIRDDIYERLTDSHHIDARGILVDVNQGNVTLNGTVGERRMRYMAEDLVERVSGVSNINNQLRVQKQEEPQRTSLQQQQEDKRH